MKDPDPVPPGRLRAWRFLPHGGAGYFRLLVDAGILGAAVTLATFLRLLWMISQERLDPDFAITRSAQSLFDNLALVLPVSLVSFALLGFYTFGTYYQNRFKAFAVIRGAMLALLVCSLLALLAREHVDFSRSAIIISFALATPALILVRIGSWLWLQLARTERSLRPAVAKPVDQQRILVIGGAGYIGSALVGLLLDRGYRVRVLDRMLYGQEPIAPMLGNPRLEIMRADLRQVDSVVQAMQDVDAVVHLGAIVGDPACALNEQVTIDINLVATRMIAEVAKGLGIKRFVFASTCSVYGASDELLDEQSALNPVSLYARTKIACERVLIRLADPDFRPCILRFATIYGLSGRTRFDLVINLLTAKAAFDREITVSGGDQWRPFIHVEDAAIGIVHALHAPPDVVGGQIYNIGGNGENYTIDQAALLIQSVVPAAVIKEIPFDGDRRNYRVCFDKAERDLAFRPKWALRQGIVQVAEAIQSGRITTYREPQYSNVTFLKGGVVATLEPVDPLAEDLGPRRESSAP
jgi:nucleoside-diphosphate-sugar epimerase